MFHFSRDGSVNIYYVIQLSVDVCFTDSNWRKISCVVYVRGELGN